MPKITYLDHISTLLPADEVQLFQSCYLQRLPKTIKVITSKISTQDFKKMVEDMGREIEETIHSDCFYVHTYTDSATLGQHFLHQGGFFYIQELSASMSAPLLDAQPGEIILDMCAAPGGKTIQLADTGSFVVANEPLNPRRKALIYNINRCGMINTAVTNMEGSRFGKEYPELFDKILVDAPCSGEGMSYKTGGPISWNEGQIKSLARTQINLLESAIAACKVGGTIVYSTCTLNEIENEEVITKIAETYKGIVDLVLNKKYRPHRDKCGGFFLAKFHKIAPTLPSSYIPQHNKKPPLFDYSTSLQSKVKTYLADTYGIKTLPSNSLLYATINSIYLTTKDYISLHGKLSLDKVGIPIFDIARDGRRIPLHALGNILGNLADTNILPLTTQQVQAYAEQKDFPIDKTIQSSPDNFLLVTWKKYGFSLAKRVGDIFKNKLL